MPDLNFFKNCQVTLAEQLTLEKNDAMVPNLNTLQHNPFILKVKKVINQSASPWYDYQKLVNDTGLQERCIGKLNEYMEAQILP